MCRTDEHVILIKVVLDKKNIPVKKICEYIPYIKTHISKNKSLFTLFNEFNIKSELLQFFDGGP